MRHAEEMMQLALEQAVMDANEVPVGAVIEKDGQGIALAHNEREKGSCFAHAEVLAMERACKVLGTRRLSGCTMYVTLEPCPMCAGAIINARIPRVVYGAGDAKCGAVRSVCSMFSMEFNHHPEVTRGVREEEAAALLAEFFRNLRVELRSRPRWKRPER